MKTRKETVEACKAIRAAIKEMTKIFNHASEEKFRQCVTLADNWIAASSEDDLDVLLDDGGVAVFKDYLRKHAELFETSAHGAQSMAHICRSFLMILENAPDKLDVPVEEACDHE